MKLILLTLLFTLIFSQWHYTSTNPACTNADGSYQSDYNGGANAGGACVVKYCTTPCNGVSFKFALNVNPNDWHDWVTMEGIFQPYGGAATNVVKDCGAIQAYRPNVVAWGYDVGTIIDARVTALSNFCQVAPNCPSGTTLNNGQCQTTVAPTCPSGYVYQAGACIPQANCPSGYTLSGQQCIMSTSPVCPTNYFMSGSMCVIQSQPTIAVATVLSNTPVLDDQLLSILENRAQGLVERPKRPANTLTRR